MRSLLMMRRGIRSGLAGCVLVRVKQCTQSEHRESMGRLQKCYANNMGYPAPIANASEQCMPMQIFHCPRKPEWVPVQPDLPAPISLKP